MSKLGTPLPPNTAKFTKMGAGGTVLTAALAIVAAVLSVEGGYVNNPKDPGGETNHGVTVAVARENGYTGSMKELPVETAQEIYMKKYIESPNFLPMVEVQPAVAEKLVDAGVNTGPARPSRWFQQSLNALSNDGKLFPQTSVDGKVGSHTVQTYRELEKVRGKVKACQLTLKLLDAYQATYYVSINNPTFTAGWIDHRIGNVPLSKCK